MRIEARAKINWTLDVLGVREDGYHLLDMLMQPVTLCDLIDLETAKDITLRMSGDPLLPADEHNLAMRAARLLQRETGTSQGAAIHVEKRIPAGAGMGGGSADCAGVLAGLNRLWGLNLSQTELETLGLRLGADVPFCLRGGLCRVGGIGEDIRREDAVPLLPLVIVQPCEGLSTGQIFRDWHSSTDAVRPDTDRALDALRAGDPRGLSAAIANALQPVSVAARPQIGEAIDLLRELGAAAAMMTGSGSAVFGVFGDGAAADNAFLRVKQRWPRTFRCDSCGESIVM